MQITLLSDVYEATPFDELTMSSDFSYVIMFLQGQHMLLSEMSDEQLIHILKYADYLNYTVMQDYIGSVLASRLENMNMEKLSAFQEKFNSIE